MRFCGIGSPKGSLLGYFGDTSYKPAVRNLTRLMPLSSKNLATAPARADDNSQFEGYCALENFSSLVCPSILNINLLYLSD